MLPVPFRRMPPLVAGATAFAPVGSVSLDSQSPKGSLRIQFPCHPASRWDYGFWAGVSTVFSIGPQAQSACFPPRRTGRVYGFPSSLAHQLTSPLAHYRGFIQTGAAGAHHNPLNPLNPLNLLNLLNSHAQRACPKSRSVALPMHSFFLIFQMFVYLSA